MAQYVPERPRRGEMVLMLLKHKLEGTNVKGSSGFEANLAFQELSKDAAYLVPVKWVGYDKESKKVQAVLDLSWFPKNHALLDEDLLGYYVYFAAFSPGARESVEIIKEENDNSPPAGLTAREYWVVVSPLD